MWNHVSVEKQSHVTEGGSLLATSSLKHSHDTVSGDSVETLPSTADFTNEQTAKRGAGNSSRIRKCCRAFGIGLFYGISLATLLSLAVLYIELTHTKNTLAAVQDELRQIQHVRGKMRGTWHHVSEARRIGASDIEEEEELPSTMLNDVDDNRGDIVSRKARREVRQRSPSASGQSRGNGVTQEQVKQLIRTSLMSMYLPSAHLSCYSPPELHNNSRSFHEEHVLYWTQHHQSGLTHNNVFNYGSDYSRLVVQTSGTYFIYVQIMYNGRRKSNQPTCSHAVKLFPSGTPHTAKLLLHSSRTQYNLGRPIYVQYDGAFVHAYDSSFLAGVFHLEPGDQLRVELDDFSRNCRIVHHADRTYFGAFRLHPLIADIL